MGGDMSSKGGQTASEASWCPEAAGVDSIAMAVTLVSVLMETGENTKPRRDKAILVGDACSGSLPAVDDNAVLVVSVAEVEKCIVSKRSLISSTLLVVSDSLMPAEVQSEGVAKQNSCSFSADVIWRS
ncbi:expressed protein [Batrachochytrium dendrobatidis JAM81]|uniref:Expressed protein n=1 Tax=Batrachochytrium dendrobatidis (strain JAM81 / FGSC 10211) TaxID=684364 RepID=F4PCG3_BATDJ|nr:uncharacterized protein BATDEDRAFT_37468 [Batrachochytrium dendrobatidis JAM81]EGF77083.1 expressed protein [Batrachochytrium dendrobatidis JAM81]|eukprot:XP_006682244.1 expressed protein [Batrachochytrium dendrobatidis JAM81]